MNITLQYFWSVVELSDTAGFPDSPLLTLPQNMLHGGTNYTLNLMVLENGNPSHYGQVLFLLDD